MNPESIVEDTIKQYGINMRGSGQNIGFGIEHYGAAGALGKTKKADVVAGNPRIYINRYITGDESTLANTIAHELSHARDYLREALLGAAHKPHGTDASVGDGSVYGAGNALEAWIRGER